MSDPKDFPRLEHIFEEWKDLDIGIVVNNAGTTSEGSYFSIKPGELIRDVNIDFLVVLIINRIIVPRMRTRAHRSAILNISSCTSIFLSSKLGVYSAVKRTADIYSQLLGM
jgi:short-subunit dehydrogenase